MPDEEFDFAKFDADFEAEYGDGTEVEVVDEVVDSEVIVEDENTDELEETEEVAGDDSSEAVDTVPSRTENQAKHDATFAQMRRELAEATKTKQWLEQLAQENGTTVEEMQRRHSESKLQQESEKQGIPVEVLKRLSSVEQENHTIKEQLSEERFNASVVSTVNKYGATEQEVEQAFIYARDEGLVEAVRAGAISFDALYRLAHLESFTEKKVQSALQDTLAQKKKRQQEAPIGNGGGSASTITDLDDQAMQDAKAIIASGGF